MDSHWNSKGERRVYLSREEVVDIAQQFRSMKHEDCFICRDLLRKLDEAREAFGEFDE
jgi:hypothetical protein